MWDLLQKSAKDRSSIIRALVNLGGRLNRIKKVYCSCIDYFFCRRLKGDYVDLMVNIYNFSGKSLSAHTLVFKYDIGSVSGEGYTR